MIYVWKCCFISCTEYYTLKNSYIETWSPIMVFGGETSEKWLGHKGRGLLKGISALMERHEWDEMSLWKPVAVLSPESDYAITLILDFPISRTMKNKFLLFKPPSLCFLS